MALVSEATEILFGGASEGGKSHLIRVALCLWCLAIPKLQCVLIRKKFDDIKKNHVEGPNGFRSLLSELVEAGFVSIVEKGIKFKNGSNIDFVHCQDERQFDSAQGIEKHVIVVDEATQISHILLTMFRGWCRMDKAMQEKIPESITLGDVVIPLKGRFPRIMYTGNPIGKSVGWFRRNFVIARPDFAIEEVHGFLRQYIPSKVTDNLSVDLAAHKGRLAAFDPSLARALDEGDWNSPIGDFFRGYDEAIHVIPDFRPPDYWFKYRSFDWGSAEPFCVLWHCVADGEEFKAINGTTLWAQAGTIITYREWYGCDKDEPAKGIGMRNEQIAKGILQRTTETMQFQPIVTDSLPFQDRGNAGASGEKFTTADDFASFGVPLARGNCARVFGWNQCTNRLIGTERGPLCMIAESCRYLREYIPTIERDPSNPEDCVSDGEATHTCFTGETLVNTPNGNQRIDTLTAGDFIIAGDGLARPISWAGKTGEKEIIELEFDDGSIIRCTPDHKILTQKGWISACDTLRLCCIVKPCKLSLFQTLSKNLTISDTFYTRAALKDLRTKRCVKINKRPKLETVYCLTEPITGAFQLASSHIVSNCDTWRLAMTSKPLTISKPQESTPLQKGDFDKRITPKVILKQLKRQRR